MILIVGLGNPGNEDNNTRHNVGFTIIDNLATKLGVEVNNNKHSGLFCQTIINNEKVILLKPQKFINLSGEVIKSFISYYKIEIDDILIIHDDLDLEIGTCKLRNRGSSGGHNGLKSIESNIGTDEYKRLKIGISNNKNMATRDYVLGSFSKEEELIIGRIIDRAQDIILDYIKLDFSSLMNKYNGL